MRAGQNLGPSEPRPGRLRAPGRRAPEWAGGAQQPPRPLPTDREETRCAVADGGAVAAAGERARGAAVVGGVSVVVVAAVVGDGDDGGDVVLPWPDEPGAAVVVAVAAVGEMPRWLPVCAGSTGEDH